MERRTQQAARQSWRMLFWLVATFEATGTFALASPRAVGTCSDLRAWARGGADPKFKRAILIPGLAPDRRLDRAEDSPAEKPGKPETSQAAGDHTEVPVVFYDRNGFVQVTINHKKRTFLVDTASLTIVNLDRLDLPVVRKASTRAITATGSSKSKWQLVRVDTLALGGAALRDLRVLAKNLRELEAAFGREVDGILGNDVLMRWDSVKIDYKNGKLVLEGFCEVSSSMAARGRP